MSDLLSVVVTLQPLAAASVRADLGRACQGWFLGLVEGLDPALAGRLHEQSQRRPYTVSSLRGAGPARGGRLALDVERPVWLRITSLEAALSALLLEELAPRLPEEVDLLGAPLRVTGSTHDAARHPWAGRTSYEALLEGHVLGGETPGPELALRLASPTSFRRTGTTFEGQRVPDHDLPLPLPGLVFGGLADAWQAFAPVKLARDVRAFAGACVALDRYRLKTRWVDAGRGQRAGVQGTCRYRALAGDDLWLRLSHLLLDYSFYCGVGRGTAAGWGQARPRR